MIRIPFYPPIENEGKFYPNRDKPVEGVVWINTLSQGVQVIYEHPDGTKEVLAYLDATGDIINPFEAIVEQVIAGRIGIRSIYCKCHLCKLEFMYYVNPMHPLSFCTEHFLIEFARKGCYHVDGHIIEKAYKEATVIEKPYNMKELLSDYDRQFSNYGTGEPNGEK